MLNFNILIRSMKKGLVLIGGIFLLAILLPSTSVLKSHYEYFVDFHVLMIGVAFPSAIIYLLFWDPESERAKNPKSQKYMRTIYIVIIAAVSITIVYYLVFPWLESKLTSLFIGLIYSPSFWDQFIISLWFIVSIPLLSIIMVGLACPAKVGEVLNSLSNLLEDNEK